MPKLNSQTKCPSCNYFLSFNCENKQTWRLKFYLLFRLANEFVFLAMIFYSKHDGQPTLELNYVLIFTIFIKSAFTFISILFIIFYLQYKYKKKMTNKLKS